MEQNEARDAELNPFFFSCITEWVFEQFRCP